MWWQEKHHKVAKDFKNIAPQLEPHLIYSKQTLNSLSKEKGVSAY